MTHIRYQGPEPLTRVALGPIGLALVPPGFTPPAEPFDAWELLRSEEAQPPPGGLLREFFHHGILHAR